MMKSTLSKIAIFGAGAIVGSVITWKVVETRYEKIIEEEIDSVREAFAIRMGRVENTTIDNELDEIDDDVETLMPRNSIDAKGYEKLLNREKYKDYARGEDDDDDVSDDKEAPYVITPEEFGWLHDYETISLTYYADGVLTDEEDDVIDDVDDAVGEDSLTHFGEYADDAVYVRNDKRKCDYEILKDERKYSDVFKKYPHRAED